MLVKKHIPGPFEISSVQEYETSANSLNFIFPDLSNDKFSSTRAFKDSRFVNPINGFPKMSYHSFILRTPHGIVLVDTCVGAHKEHPLIAEWHMQNYPYLNRLKQLNLTPADIDFVCCTHLHGDHVGWNTRLENGHWVPTFPNARYLIAKPEYDYWENIHNKTKNHVFKTAWNESVLPVMEAGQIDKVSAEHEIFNGVQLRPAFGHSPGNVVIDVSDGKRSAILTGDVLHHPVQIERPEWYTVFDDDQKMALDTRIKTLERIADRGTVMLAGHFGGATPLIIESGKKYFRYTNPI
ncbi:MAG: MBL fold metallo-hydrolase [Pseudomonadota bacterium]|nr:MBL fold metallo-hydrolase [Pseudomonadota bacterium]